jgi:hypothetical protein
MSLILRPLRQKSGKYPEVAVGVCRKGKNGDLKMEMREITVFQVMLRTRKSTEGSTFTKC